MEEVVERVTPGTRSWEQYGAEHMQRYEFFKKFYNNAHVLDAACGTGYGTSLIAESGASAALGIDVSKDALAFATLNYKKSNLKYLEHDCGRLDSLSEKFNVVVSFETIEHLSDPENFIRTASKVLNPGGTFICSTPNKARLSGSGNINPFHPSELEWKDFKAIFEKYFNVEACYHQTETITYLRIQELKHLLHQNQARNNAYFFNRLEVMARKLISKNFKPAQYIHPSPDDLQPADMEIEVLKKPESWHKTFIIVGQVKSAG